MRRIGSIVVRLAGALISAGLVAGLLLLPGTQPWEPTALDPLAIPVPAAPTDLVCPGAVRLPTEPEEGDDVAYDPQFDPAPVEAESSLLALSVDRPDGPAVPGDVRSMDGTQVLDDVVPAAGGGVATVQDLDAGLVVHADAAEGGPAWLAGSVAVQTAGGDLRGLVAAACRPATSEAWLVGGSTSLGSSARLVLQNPGSTAAQVTLEVWGPAGPVELAGAAEYLVPPGSERVVLLEGTAAEQPRIVVHVTVAGGAVAAYLQDSELRGLTPAGVDEVVPGTNPATQQVVPGVAIAGTPADGADPGLLRLLAPTESGTARVRVLGPDGLVELPGAAEVELVAGAVLDVPLDGVPAGDWAIVVDADVPVLAGAMLTRGLGVGASGESDEPLERAWSAAVSAGGAPLALPRGVQWRLSVANPTGGAATAEVDVVDLSGAVVASDTVTVLPGTAVSLDAATLVPESAAVAVAGVVVRGEDVAWSAVLTVDDGTGEFVSVLSPVAPRVTRGDVAVRLD